MYKTSIFLQNHQKTIAVYNFASALDHQLSPASNVTFPLNSLNRPLILFRGENVPGPIVPARWYHVRSDSPRTEVIQGDTSVRILEHAILSIGGGVRQVRL